jgi:DNA-binding MarR family transcriptional regulator
VDELPVVEQPLCRSAAPIDYLHRQMRLASEEVLAPLGLRPRHFVALTMLRDNQEISQQALSSILQIDGANIVGLLNELESAGLVTRRRAAEDRRRHIVEMTDGGRRLLARAEFALGAVEDHVFSALSSEERQQLAALLHRAMSGTFPA